MCPARFFQFPFMKPVHSLLCSITCLLACTVCPVELQLASKRCCLLMIMNAVCLLDVLSGSPSICSAQTRVTAHRCHCKFVVTICSNISATQQSNGYSLNPNVVVSSLNSEVLEAGLIHFKASCSLLYEWIDEENQYIDWA